MTTASGKRREPKESNHREETVAGLQQVQSLLALLDDKLSGLQVLELDYKEVQHVVSSVQLARRRLDETAEIIFGFI